MNHEAMSALSSERKRKKAISVSTAKSQRIGIMLKLEITNVPASDVTDRWETLMYFISKNEIIHI